MRDITPEKFRCLFEALSPAIYDLEDGRIAIRGRYIPHGDLPKPHADEGYVVLPYELLQELAFAWPRAIPANFAAKLEKFANPEREKPIATDEGKQAEDFEESLEFREDCIREAKTEIENFLAKHETGK